MDELIGAAVVAPYDDYVAAVDVVVVAVVGKDELEDAEDSEDLLNLVDASVDLTSADSRQSFRVPRSVRYFDQTS